MKRLVVFGCGYSARRFVALHGAGFDAVDVTASSADTVAKLAAEGLSAHLFDGAERPESVSQAVMDATHVLVSIPPTDRGDVALGYFLRPLLAGFGRSLRWIGYLSTIGVYGDERGGWVSESTPVSRSNERISKRIDAEDDWLSWMDSGTDLRVQVFRLAGIYGPGRSQIDNLRVGTAKRLVKPGQVFNRIHVDDIAAAIAAGIARPNVGPIINVTDDEPAPPQDVVAYAAQLLGIEPPSEQPFETAEISEMARSFYSSNKRVANRLLRYELGVELAYPTYREGIAALAR